MSALSKSESVNTFELIPKINLMAKVQEEELKTVLLSFIENAKNLKTFNIPLTFSETGDVCELLDALQRSGSFNTIEHVPLFTQDIFDDD